ncbi:FAD-binding domain-containing protein [Lentinus brumalis]|uniref:FAD-binding domain-containing protein n=1 Tax=Lentinus brumalis TaxID=2498619 RepID=A0A371DYB2_9APHY|nr:FAD-binding domain-containing protein [Polyporus brumalis]
MVGKYASISILSFLLAWLGQRFTHTEPRCRCLYGDSCWPSEDAFIKLAEQLSAPLIYPRPLALPCYSNPDSSACAAVHARWDDGTWRAEHPGATQHPNFEALITPSGEVDACYANSSIGSPCGQGSVPVIGVKALTLADVRIAVKFAAEHNLKFVIKNTGHDFLGRSSGHGSFMLWMHHMKDIAVDEVFRPLGAPEGVYYEFALTIGAGVQWHEAYAAADNANRMIVGGISPGGSVGAAGGWLLGGGHSALSPTYGLGVDNVIQISLVTSTGDHLVANAHHHADLFWALRGGGGGTFGVITSVTYRTYPIVPTVLATMVVSVKSPELTDDVKTAFTELIRITTNLTDAGWGGYAMFESTGDTRGFSLGALVPNVSWEEANRTIMPYFDYVKSLAMSSDSSDEIRNGAFKVEGGATTEWPSFWSLYKHLMPNTGQVGRNLELGSWLLPRDVLDEDHEHVAKVLLENPGLSYELIAGGAVSKVDPSSTGLNPAWRKAVVHAVFGITWPDGASAEEIQQLRGSLESRLTRVRALAPDSGAYLNEASLFEPDARHAFFGGHYEKLRAVKRKYDPTDLFLVTEGVGADEWDEQLRCRV